MVLLTASPAETVPYPACRKRGPYLPGEAPAQEGGWAWRLTAAGKEALRRQQQAQREHYCSGNLQPPKLTVRARHPC